MDGQVKIAIIDDDQGIRDALDGLLDSFGYSITAFECAEDFLASRDRHTADCIITDVRMPGMSGLELQEVLNAEGAPPPIIFMTSYCNDTTRRRAFAYGARDVLGKPVDDTSLVAAIEAAVAPQAK